MATVNLASDSTDCSFYCAAIGSTRFRFSPINITHIAIGEGHIAASLSIFCKAAINILGFHGNVGERKVIVYSITKLGIACVQRVSKCCPTR